MRELEMAQEAFVQGLSVQASASQPPRNRGLSKAKDPLGGGRVEPFGQSREHHSDLLRRGFQAIQGGIASSTEGGATSLAAKRLDALDMALLTISHPGVDPSVCDPEVEALMVGASKPRCVDAFGCSPPAFDLAPGTHRYRRWPSI